MERFTDSARRSGARLAAEHQAGDPFAEAIRATRMAMIITDPREPDNPIVFVNDAFSELTGYDREEVIGRNCRLLQGPETDPRAIDELRAAMAQLRPAQVDILNYKKSGEAFWNALYVSPVLDQDGRCVYFFGSQIDVTDRKRRERIMSEDRDRFEGEVQRRTAELRGAMGELERALAARTVLLHEVNHRVKNNLQTISSLIGLEARRQPEGPVKSVLHTMLQRVEALSMVHRRLYAAEDEPGFEVADFARELAASKAARAGEGVKLEFRASPVVVHAGKAAPLALLINELLRCALETSAPNGRVVVEVERANGSFRLEVAHDGASEAFCAPGSASFERTLVETLCRQLQAEFTMSHDADRSRLRVIVPVHRLQDE